MVCPLESLCSLERATEPRRGSGQGEALRVTRAFDVPADSALRTPSHRRT